MRLYDKALVAKIHENQFTKEVDGIPVLFKPVPDAEPAHLDPRLREIIIKKRTMFANRAKAGWTLSSERYRPDKVTYDLIETPVDCTEQLIPIGGHKIDIYIYRAANIQPNAPVLVYLHGGGFTAGDIHLFGKQMQYIAEQSGAVVVFPEYRLAPENPFPAPVEDAWGAVQWVHAHAAELGADPAKLMVAGDSAGGSLTNACVLQDEKGIIRKIMASILRGTVPITMSRPPTPGVTMLTRWLTRTRNWPTAASTASRAAWIRILTAATACICRAIPLHTTRWCRPSLPPMSS